MNVVIQSEDVSKPPLTSFEDFIGLGRSAHRPRRSGDDLSTSVPSARTATGPANRERNAPPDPALANFSTHARCHTGPHAVTHIKTLEIFKTQRAQQGSACSRRRPPPSSEAPLWKRLASGRAPFVACAEACVPVSSVSQVGTFVPSGARSGREGGWSSEFRSRLSGRGGGGSVWEVEEEENRGSAPVGSGTY